MCNNIIPFRTHIPTRTYSGKELKNYKSYKDQLAKDFQGRCGYTDCDHFWFGGKNNFQIDHFKPKSKYPELLNSYSNLVYSCSYVNRAKSNDDNEYLDPCTTDYNQHFNRDNQGNILPKEHSNIANYMYIKLKLYLKRYGIIWMLTQLEQKMYLLQKLIERTDDDEAKKIFIKVTFEYNNYKKYLRAIQ